MSDQKFIDTIIAEELEEHLFNEDQGYVSPNVRKQWALSVTDMVLAALRANNIAVVELPEPDALGEYPDDKTWEDEDWRVIVWGDDAAGEVQVRAACSIPVARTRGLAAALLAAADAAERAE